MNIESALKEFGLNKNQIAIYLAALKVGGGTAQAIAKAADLPRTTIYGSLNYLINLQLIYVDFKNKKRIYTARHPEKLINILLAYERHLQTAMPEFLSRYQSSGQRPKIKFFQGLNSAKEVWDDTLKIHNKTIKVISIADIHKVFSRTYFEQYIPRRIEARIKLQSINPQNKTKELGWEPSKQQLREVHYTPNDFIPPISLIIYDNKIALCGSQKENFGLIIEAEHIYQTFKNIFDIYWQITTAGKTND